MKFRLFVALFIFLLLITVITIHKHVLLISSKYIQNLTASHLLDHDYSKSKLLPSAAWIPTIISNCSGFFSFGPPTSTPQLAWFCRNSGQIMSLLSSNPVTYPSKSPKSSQGPTGPVPPSPQLLLLLSSLCNSSILPLLFPCHGSQHALLPGFLQDSAKTSPC